ncbi:hypothetical protein K875_05682 [Mycobacterium [tuberculosis] TKK-01-0051]|uniref:Uncharacterized protein n=1 Tax=Mycobacterium [tuberculosis] TKK-01-0051 TaxID=1324261 RepID=A0A051TJU0_9MYCO|nr:hypothetical protein K875_05682 [Mycobacterium [tuberculosis] TKK-01-0051]
MDPDTAYFGGISQSRIISLSFFWCQFGECL